jgi:hypothetical protein
MIADIGTPLPNLDSPRLFFWQVSWGQNRQFAYFVVKFPALYKIAAARI